MTGFSVVRQLTGTRSLERNLIRIQPKLDIENGKQGGLCTGITQNVTVLLQNYTVTTMLENSGFVALLKQANTDSANMNLHEKISEMKEKERQI